MALDQMKMLNQLRKAQKELKKEKVIVEAGDGLVEMTFNGELKLENVTINAEMIDLDNIDELENAIQNATRDGLAKAQEIAAEKMKPLMGGLGNLGL